MFTTIEDDLGQVLLPAATDLRLDAISADEHTRRLAVYLTSTQATSCCPRCHQPVARVHSASTLTLADLPWADVVIALQLQVRKWFCTHADCAQSIFTLEATGSYWVKVAVELHARGSQSAWSIPTKW